MADKGLKYVGESPIKGMALGSQEGYRLYLGETLIWDTVIKFEDPIAKAICVENWGGHYINGEITIKEAAAVTDIAPTSNNPYFNGCQMVSFNEFKYFTGLKKISTSGTTTLGTFQGCTKLKSITLPKISLTLVSNRAIFNSMFRGCSSLENIDLSPLATRASSNLANMFYGCSALKSVVMSPFSSVYSFTSMFYGCSNLETLTTTGCTFGSYSTTGTFTNCSKLATITGGFSGIKATLNLGACSKLDHDSALEIINSLGTVTSATLTFNSATKATLSSAELDIARNKGWNIG